RSVDGPVHRGPAGPAWHRLRNHAGSRNGNHRPAGADERGAIRDALERSSWNKAKAARMLGMSRRTIYRKIARYGISPDEEA
ncbi:MAG: helix-turn-helix domain-containing protein, partial [Thermodesulfobacteriota bacterium]